MEYIVLDQEGSETWKASRRKIVGASEAAAVMGLSDWSSAVEVWGRKVGVIEEFEGNEQTEWGKRMEPLIIDALLRDPDFINEYGTGFSSVKNTCLLQSDEYPFVGATPDYWLYGPRNRLMVEVKLTGRGDWTQGVPSYHYPQCQQQMLVTGQRKMLIVAFIGCDLSIKWCEVERNDEFIDELIYAESAFWGCVERREQPPVDGTDSCRKALEKIYPPKDEPAMVELSLDHFCDWERDGEIVREIKALKDEQDIIRNKARALVGESWKGLFPGYKEGWGWAPTKKGTRTLRRIGSDEG